MQTPTLLALLLLFILVAYGAGISRALSAARVRGGRRRLAALPSYYGLFSALWCGLPALLLLCLWQLFDDAVIRALVMETVADKPDTIAGRDLLYAQIQNLAAGHMTGDPSPQLQEATARLNRLRAGSQNLQTALTLILSIGWAPLHCCAFPRNCARARRWKRYCGGYCSPVPARPSLPLWEYCCRCSLNPCAFSGKCP